MDLRQNRIVTTVASYQDHLTLLGEKSHFSFNKVDTCFRPEEAVAVKEQSI